MNVKSRIGQLVGESINAYNNKLKPMIEEVELREEYQSRIIECMIGEVDDNYIETPETDAPIVKLEHSKEGLVKVPSIKGKTILVDADGNETDTPAEGCRLVSVGEEEDNKLIILSKNKNLIDKMVVGDIQQETGNLIPDKTGVISGYIKVKPNTNYTLSEQLTATSNWYAIFEYDKNKQLLNYHYNKRMLTSSKTHYVAFKYHSADNISGKFQFEEGSVATTYIEPKQHKAEILLDEPLRSLPNGVCDEIIGNQLIRKVGSLFINGSEDENWRIGVGSEKFTVTSIFFIDNKLPNGWYARNKICNILPTTCNSYWLDIESYCNSDAGTRLCIKIDKTRLSTNDVSGLKQWLSENPVTILYELAEPIIEELPNSIALQCFDDTTMYIENSITPTVTYGYNALIPYKEELVKQREEVDNNVLDIETNIIPYLTEIEYNLNRMEGN